VQIGERFGRGTEAARTRVRRLGWRTQPGNDGRTLARVPDDVELRPAGDREPDRDETDVTGLLTGLLAAAEARADRAEQRIEEADKRADSALALADRTMAQLADANVRADRAEARADDLRTLLDTACAKAQAAQDAEQSERRRGVYGAPGRRGEGSETV
jgi:hypothetical protein